MRDIRRMPANDHRFDTRYRSRPVAAPDDVPVFSEPVTAQLPVRRRKRYRGGLWLSGTLLLIGIFFAGAILLRYALVNLGKSAVAEMNTAVASIRQGDFELGQQALVQAEGDFTRGAGWLKCFAWLPNIAGRIPGLSHGMTAEALFRSGKEGAASARALVSILPTILRERDSPSNVVSLIDMLEHSKSAAVSAQGHLSLAKRAFERVDIDMLPTAYREDAMRIQATLPTVAGILDGYVAHQELFSELLGAHGPRVYLFLFQNNHELRATGGFIGSYALLDVNQGRIRRFFVDGIFNPDGQLKENIVPPKPIQKISAGWSLHDSNWFPDFPTSAEKAIFFYEKTGGPTVDGIITLTPEVLERVLRLVGPLPLPEYGVTIDVDNFMPIIQAEVEEKYDKEENNPKRILGDLMEVLLRRFLSFDRPQETWELGTTLATLLNERHILLYSRNSAMEQIIRAAGWSGEVSDTPRDYLSVIHTNINGYKTDGVIDETISHDAVIHADGRVTDTVSVTRKHRGGNTPYEWWNKVNADYLRVYVPHGSKLISAEGMTREFPEPPLDYAALGFRHDPDILREEEGTVIDEASGTRISEDAGKTVFGNWVYVSPGESVTVRYVYELPFRVVPDERDESSVASYSTLYQKQAGTDDVMLRATLRYPEWLRPVWQTPENLIPYQRIFETEQSLREDFYWGVVFGKNSSARR